MTVQITDRHINNCSTSLAIKEIQTKALRSLRYLYTSTGMAKITKILTLLYVGKDVIE